MRFFKLVLLCLIFVLLTNFVFKTAYPFVRFIGFYSNSTTVKNVHKNTKQEKLPPAETIAQNNVINEETMFEIKNFLIDWHDYRLIEDEKLRVGLGEHGKAAELPEAYEEKRKEIFIQNGFNGLLSDFISINRSVPDIRHPE